MGSSNIEYSNDWGTIKTPNPEFSYEADSVEPINTMIVTIIYKQVGF